MIVSTGIGFWQLSLPPTDDHLAIQVFTSSTSLLDNTDRFFSNFVQGAQPTDAGLEIPILIDCVLVSAYIGSFSAVTAGSAEAWDMFVRVNGVDTLISSVAVSATRRTWLNGTMSVPLVQGDSLVIKFTTPTWATNPSATIFSGVLLCRV